MYSDRQIYIIGPQLLFGDLMAAQIGNHTGANCHVVPHLENLTPLPTPQRKKNNLHLIDCHGLTGETLEQQIFAEFFSVTRSGHFALFNLEHQLGVEKQALSRGARGFFYINDRLEIILRGIRLILAGEIWASRKALTECLYSLPAKEMPCQKSVLGLTRREVEILSLLVEGNENETIANSLFISPHTVRTHLYHIFKKLNVKSRLQAAQWATKNL